MILMIIKMILMIIKMILMIIKMILMIIKMIIMIIKMIWVLLPIYPMMLTTLLFLSRSGSAIMTRWIRAGGWQYENKVAKCAEIEWN